MHGGVAQLGEHMHHTHGVAGSSPVVSISYDALAPGIDSWGCSLAGKAQRSQR